MNAVHCAPTCRVGQDPEQTYPQTGNTPLPFGVGVAPKIMPGTSIVPSEPAGS